MSKSKELPSVAELCEFFEDIGWTVRWKVRRSNNIWVGKEATGKLSGYYSVNLNRKRLLVHRILYKMRTGEEPEQIDHIDGNKTNNYQENLRPATNSENGRNRGLQKNSTSGFKGVIACRRSGKWRVKIMLNGKHIYGGLYDRPEDANLEAIQLRKQFHGDFAHD